jgi:hypothetical protein
MFVFCSVFVLFLFHFIFAFCSVFNVQIQSQMSLLFCCQSKLKMWIMQFMLTKLLF